MKTIKISEGLHRDLLILKAKYKLKTLDQVIRFLEIYLKERSKNDISEK